MGPPFYKYIEQKLVCLFNSFRSPNTLKIAISRFIIHIPQSSDSRSFSNYYTFCPLFKLNLSREFRKYCKLSSLVCLSSIREISRPETDADIISLRILLINYEFLAVRRVTLSANSFLHDTYCLGFPRCTFKSFFLNLKWSNSVCRLQHYKWTCTVSLKLLLDRLSKNANQRSPMQQLQVNEA
jgi:hypothetical protein